MKILKLIGKILLGLVVILLLFAIYIQFGYNVTYDRPYPSVHISTDSTVIARGEYLVRGPAHCEGCHSHPDYDTPLEAGEKVPLQGGRTFDTPLGQIFPKNLTPDNETGIGRRTDGQLARVMRYSVDANGHSIIPFFMPFTNMSDDDLSAILSYLRAQEPIRNEVPESLYSFMGKGMKRFLLKPRDPDPNIVTNIQPDSTAEYGRYLVYAVTNCVACHTKFSLAKMDFDGPHLAGGGVMVEGDHTLITPNLTPDPMTGHITLWTEEQFVQRFKAGPVFDDSPMAWKFFARMNERDVKAIYRFLQSIDPVENEIGEIVRENADEGSD